MKTIEIRGGERVRVIQRFSNSMPSTFRFSATGIDGGLASGTIEIADSKMPSKAITETRPLESDNVVEKSMWNSFFSIYVTPIQDVEITFERATTQSSRLLWLLAGLVVVAAVAVIVVPLLAQ